MRNDADDLLIDDLKVDSLKYKAHKFFRESLVPVYFCESEWLLREFFIPYHFHLHRISRDFFRLFSPEHVFEERSVYEIREGKKFFLGGIIDASAITGESILSTRDMHILIDRGVVEALSILFFLNQSYSQLSRVYVDMVDQYKVTRFDLVELNSPLTDIQYYSFLPESDQNNKEVAQFVSRLTEYLSGNSDSDKDLIFFKKRELSLLNIVISPNFVELFDFCDYADLELILSSRKAKLREILLSSDRFSEVVFQLTPGDFRKNINDFFYCLKKYDEERFQANIDISVKNYLMFFSDFLKIKLDLIFTELRREMSCVVFNRKEVDVDRIYHVLMLKGVLNQFYFLLNEFGFIDRLTLDRLPTCLVLLRVVFTIALNFDQADPHRKQITLLKNMMENIVASHELVHSFFSENYHPVLDCVEMSDEINLEEMLQYIEDWFSATDMIGLDTVLKNKNRLLLIFDRAFWLVRNEVSSSADFLKNAQFFREKIVSAVSSGEIKAVVCKLTKVTSDSFLNHFFRQLISYCFLELKLVYFIQQMISRKNFDVTVINDKVRKLLSKTITNVQIKEFWNKLLLMYDAIAKEQKWCRVDIQSAPVAHFSASSSSFFGSGGVSRIVASGAENLASAAELVAKSDSARVVVDSVRSIAGSASHSVGAAAQSAKTIVASASDFIGFWLKNS